MAHETVQPKQFGDLTGYVEQRGSFSAPLLASSGHQIDGLNSHDVADIAHFLTILHGRHPGVIDFAATKITEDAARDWLVQAMEGFAAERNYLTRLTVMAGPVSGVGTQDASSVAVHDQAKAMELLAQSDRKGCALGASLALVIDWWTVRQSLDAIAIRLGFEPRRCTLPRPEQTVAVHDSISGDPATDRAVQFGIDQLLTQQTGLWHLLDARRKSRQGS